MGNNEVESRDDGGYGDGNISPQLKISGGSVRSTISTVQFSSVHFSCSVMSDSL